MKQSKITILFDAGPMVNGNKAGVGQYTYRLIDSLARACPDELKLVGHYFNFLGRKHPVLPSAPNIRYKTSRLLPGKVLSIVRRAGLQIPFDFLIRSRGDIALFTNFVSLPSLQKLKKVVAIHDLCFEDFPQYLQAPNRSFLQKFVPRSIKNADLIVTISENTKQAIVDHYNSSPSNIFITPIPPEKPQTKKAPKPNINLPKKFLLFVSTLEPRKNYLNLARAYSLLPDKLKAEYGLVLAGGIGWESDAPLSEIKQLQENGNKIYILGYVDDSTRTYLYQKASLLVVPSHYEGFGMPILEAMSYGVPTAVSDIPVFHEVAADASVYFNKDDPKDISKCLAQVLTDQKLRDSLIKKGSARLSEYSWDKVASTLMARMRELLWKL